MHERTVTAEVTHASVDRVILRALANSPDGCSTVDLSKSVLYNLDRALWDRMFNLKRGVPRSKGFDKHYVRWSRIVLARIAYLLGRNEICRGAVGANDYGPIYRLSKEHP